MFKKRLLELCNSSKKWIAMTVLMNWISIICNILVILFIGNTIDSLIKSELEINYLRDGLYIGSLLVIRFLANYYSTRFSLNSSSEVKKILREKIYEMINFWLELGVGGFRLDVIDLIGKDVDKLITKNGPKLHEYLQEMNKRTFGGYDSLTVGETWGATPEIAKLYSSPNRKELSMVFQFEVISLDKQEGKSRWDLAPLDFIKFKETFKKWQVELYEEGWNSLFGNNHDLPRMVSRWGNDKKFRVESAKMLATMLHMQKGTPYIYQGEEIGMTNIRLNSIKDYNDIETLNVYKARRALGYSEQDVMNSIYAKSRDNGRTPMQWSKEKNAGFTEGKAWLHINDNYRYINVEDSINDENSILNYYKKLIKLRRENDVIKYGTFELILDNHKEVFAYIRKYKNIELLVICNFYSNNIEIELPNEYSEYSYETLLTNYTDSAKFSNVISLRPYETIVYKFKK